MRYSVGKGYLSTLMLYRAFIVYLVLIICSLLGLLMLLDNVQIQKKKMWELVQPHLKTDAYCVAALGGHVMRTSKGVVSCRSLRNANVS